MNPYIKYPIKMVLSPLVLLICVFVILPINCLITLVHTPIILSGLVTPGENEYMDNFAFDFWSIALLGKWVDL